MSVLLRPLHEALGTVRLRDSDGVVSPRRIWARWYKRSVILVTLTLDADRPSSRERSRIDPAWCTQSIKCGTVHSMGHWEETRRKLATIFL